MYEIPQTTGNSCLTTHSSSHLKFPTCLSCLLKRLANGLFPWACQEAFEFLGFRLIASCFHLSCLLSLLFCFAPCPTSETMGITANTVLCMTACLPAFSRVRSQWPCMCLLCSRLWGAALLVLPLGTSCTLTPYFNWRHWFEGRVALENGSIFLAPFHFLWCMNTYVSMYASVTGFPPNIYFSSLLFMSHAYSGFNPSSFFPVLCFTSLISKSI